MTGKHITNHEIADPTRLHSRAFRFPLPDGHTAVIEITIIPSSFSLLRPALQTPTNSQVIQSFNAAAATNITNFLN